METKNALIKKNKKFNRHSTIRQQRISKIFSPLRYKNTSDHPQTLTNIAYWLGIGADALWAVGLLFPQVFGILTGTPDFNPDLQHRLAMGIGGTLMTGWTFLLLWAVRKPIERRFVILLTAYPVVFRNVYNNTYWNFYRWGFQLLDSDQNFHTIDYDDQKLYSCRKDEKGNEPGFVKALMLSFLQSVSPDKKEELTYMDVDYQGNKTFYTFFALWYRY